MTNLMRGLGSFDALPPESELPGLARAISRGIKRGYARVPAERLPLMTTAVYTWPGIDDLPPELASKWLTCRTSRSCPTEADHHIALMEPLVVARRHASPRAVSEEVRPGLTTSMIVDVKGHSALLHGQDNLTRFQWQQQGRREGDINAFGGVYESVPLPGIAFPCGPDLVYAVATSGADPRIDHIASREVASGVLDYLFFGDPEFDEPPLVRIQSPFPGDIIVGRGLTTG